MSTAQQIRPQMSQAFLKELGESAIEAAKRKVKVQIDPNKAREAIGLEPDKSGAAKPVGKPGLAK